MSDMTPHDADGIIARLDERIEELEAEIAALRVDAGKTAIALIAAERRRQVDKEGWTPEHDDTHDKGELSNAAACYAVSKEVRYLQPGIGWMEVWPAEWDFKPKDRLTDLVRAGALIAAEIDRLQRAKEQQ